MFGVSKKYFPRLLMISLLSMLLQGCSSLPMKSSQDEAIAPIPGKRLLSNYWDLRSKVGFYSEQENGSASLRWSQQGEAFDITLFDPLGRQLGHISSDGALYVFQSKDSQIEGNSSEDIMLQLTGKPLPVSQLKYWIKGMKAPFLPTEPLSASPHHIEFIQANWHVNISGFQLLNEFRVPKKVIVEYPADPESSESKIRLKFLIKEWNLPDA